MIYAINIVRLLTLASMVMLIAFRKQGLGTKKGRITFFCHSLISLAYYVLVFFDDRTAPFNEHIYIMVINNYWAQNMLFANSSKRTKIIFTAVMCVLISFSFAYTMVTVKDYSLDGVIGLTIIFVVLIAISIALLFIKEKAPEQVQENEVEEPCPDPIGFKDGQFIYQEQDDQTPQSTN